MKKSDNRYASHSLNTNTEVFAFLRSNCGLKGATDLHNWLPSCNSILWDAGNGRPFLRCQLSIGLLTQIIIWKKNMSAEMEKLFYLMTT